MNVLYVNLLPDNHIFGHKNIDTNLINYLTKFGKVDVIATHNWYSKINSNSHVLELNREEYKGKIGYYWICLKKTLKVLKRDRKAKYDYIILASADVYMALLVIFFKTYEKRIFIIHHDNIDSIYMNKKKRFFFRLYKKKIHHIVLEKYIYHFLIHSLNVPVEKTHLVSHPCNKKQLNLSVYDCVGISNSNEERWIHQLINQEIEYSIFKKENLQVLLRSKLYTYDDGYLHVISGILPSQKYDDYITSAKALLLPFPVSFQYRASGSLIDALSNGIYVIGSDIPCFQYYSRKYPNICKTVSEGSNFIMILKKIGRNTEMEKKEFEAFREEHSEDVILKQLKAALQYEK